MPTLAELPDLFHGYNPSQGYIAIPKIPAGDPFADLLKAGDPATKAAFALLDFKSFASVAQGALAKQAQLMQGVPSWIVEPFSQVFEFLPQVSDGYALAKGIVSGVAAVASTAITVSSCAVPVVGPIIAAAAAVATGIINLVQMLREDDGDGSRPEETVQPMLYSYDQDVAYGQLFDSIAGSRNWTEAFLPVNDDPEWKVARTEGPSSNVSLRWGAPANLGNGLVPGMADMVGTYQCLSLGSAPTTVGDVRPAGRKFSMMLWQMAMKPSVAMFNIDSNKVESAWAGYFDSLWKSSYNDFSSLGLSDYDLMWLRARMRQSASYSRLYECAGGNPSRGGYGSMAPEESEVIKSCLVDWKDPGSGYKPPVFKPESVIKAFPRALLAKKLGGEGKLTGLYTDIVRYACKVHRERAGRALQTLLCAYVPSDAPLLKGDPVLAAQHREMRTLLITHHERYKLDRALIPRTTDADKAFLAKLNDGWLLSDDAVAAMNFDLGIKAGKGRMKQQGIIPAIPGVLRLPDVPAPDVGLPEGIDAPSSGGRDGGWGWVLAGAGGLAVVGTGIYLARRRRR